LDAHSLNVEHCQHLGLTLSSRQTPNSCDLQHHTPKHLVDWIPQRPQRHARVYHLNGFLAIIVRGDFEFLIPASEHNVKIVDGPLSLLRGSSRGATCIMSYASTVAHTPQHTSSATTAEDWLAEFTQRNAEGLAALGVPIVDFRVRNVLLLGLPTSIGFPHSRLRHRTHTCRPHSSALQPSKGASPLTRILLISISSTENAT
jgi:hypothetical protein